MNYANDNVIGYKYVFSLSGYVTTIQNGVSSGFDAVLEEADSVRNIFNKNGANLVVTDANNNILLKAYGSKIVSINMEPNSNNWVNYINYTMVIEFSEVDYIGCDDNPENLCDEIKIKNYASSLVDISKYKIKSFNDNWQINLGDNIYNNFAGLPNEHFEITYTVSAEGMHSYKKNTKDLLPAWEQAKNFCQDRLYKQIRNGLLSNILKTYPNNTACNPASGATIDKIHSIDTDNMGILNIGVTYDVFNEKVTCETSESLGTFSLTYSAIVKDIARSSAFAGHSNCVHTINIVKETVNNNTEQDVRMRIDGTIQGLVRGGLVNGNYQLELPQNGSLLINRDNNVTKYDNAKAAYDDIYSNGDFKNTYKIMVGITAAALGSSCAPTPSQYSANHDYNQGSISYDASFSRKEACLGGTYYSNVTATIQDPVERIAEFVIPGKSKTYVQKLNSYTPRTITLNIEGYIRSDCCLNFALYADRYCNNNEALISILPPTAVANALLTEEKHNINPLDGSFNVQRVYTYYDY